MKKIFSISFLLIFLFNAMGYFVVFQLEQYSIKAEMRSNINLGIADDRVSVISIDNQLINSTITFFNQNEFTYKGELYDVIKKEANSGKTTFYAVNDTKEEHLFSSLENHIETHSEFANPKHPVNSKNFSKNLVKLYFFENISFSFDSSERSVTYQSMNLIEYSADNKATLLPPKLA